MASGRSCPSRFARDLIALVLLWKLSHWRPGVRFSLSHLLELTRFSVSNFVAQLALFAENQAGSILLGLLFGPVAVGLYRFAMNVVNTVASVLISSIQAVSFPEFSRLQNHPKALRQSILTCIRLSSAATLPTLAGLGAVSGSFIALLGPKWQPATMVLRILCAFAIVLTFTYFTGPLLQALSQTGRLALLEWSRFGIGSLVLVCVGYLERGGGVGQQLIGVALARFATAAVMITPVYVYILMRLARISVWEWLSAVAPSAVAAAGVVAAVVTLDAAPWFTGTKPSIALTMEIAVGGVTGLTLLLWLERRLRAQVLRQIARSFHGELAPSVSTDF